MEFEITWVDPTLVVCRTSGVAEVKGYEEFLRAISSNPEFGPDVSVLMDLTELDLSPLTVADLEKLAALRAQQPRRRTATVVGQGSPLKYGLGRMFEGLLSLQLEFEIRVFEELDEAMAWLKADDANPAP